MGGAILNIQARTRDNIKMNLAEIGLEGVEQIYVVWNKDWWRTLMNTIVNLMAANSRGIAGLGN